MLFVLQLCSSFVGCVLFYSFDCSFHVVFFIALALLLALVLSSIGVIVRVGIVVHVGAQCCILCIGVVLLATSFTLVLFSMYATAFPYIVLLSRFIPLCLCSFHVLLLLFVHWCHCYFCIGAQLSLHW
jgi:hypothetical protein